MRLTEQTTHGVNEITNIKYSDFKKLDSPIKIKGLTVFGFLHIHRKKTQHTEESKVRIPVTHVGDINPSLLSINDKESLITFDIDLEFEVTITGPDFSTHRYNYENAQSYGYDTLTVTKPILTTFTAELCLQYEFVDGALINARYEKLFLIDALGGIEVEIEKDD